MELEALAEAKERFVETGATLVLISPQLEEHNRAIGEEKKLAVEILSDPGNKVAESYGIRFALPEDLKKIYQQFGIRLNEFNGDETWTLPMPARLVIDRGGIVCHADVNSDYTQRPDPEETLKGLKTVV